MNPRRHPSAAVLADFVAGSLPAAREIVVATHAGSCPECASQIAVLEAVGGALLEELSPTPMSEDSLSLVLGRSERPPPHPAAAPPPAPSDWIKVPSAVREAARRRRWVAPGVWVAPVTESSDGLRAFLLRIAPGMSVPRHTHRGVEMVCVLKGRFDDDGVLHEPGDFAESVTELVHEPRATPDGECVCLFAVEGRLRPLDWLGRLFQPFVGI